MRFKCPKCRGGDFIISEFFEGTDEIVIENGAVSDRFRGSEAQSLRKFAARCFCGHTWVPRSTTALAAVDAAIGLNDGAGTFTPPSD